LHQTEIVGLLAHVVVRVRRVDHLEGYVAGRREKAERLLQVHIFLELALLVDHEVLRGVLLAKHLQEMRKSQA